MTEKQKPRPLAQRLMWFAVLWLGGVGTVAMLSYGLRLWLAPKGGFHATWPKMLATLQHRGN
jgi:hypothetical protein